MGHYESSRINWEMEKFGCEKSPDGKHKFSHKNCGYGIVKCIYCGNVVYTT